MPGKDDQSNANARSPGRRSRWRELIRFVVGPDEAIVPDTDAKAEGRGVWVTLGEKQSVAEAVKKKAFAKSLKTNVTVPDDLAALTRLRLEQRLLASAADGQKGRPDR